MTKAQILTRLEYWQSRQQEIDKRIGELAAMAEQETGFVADMIGDTTGTLKWWKHQCKYGDTPLSAGKGNKMRPIKTLKQLAELIAE